MFENHRRGRQARNFKLTNVPKILGLKSSSEEIFPKIAVGWPLRIGSAESVNQLCGSYRLIKFDMSVYPPLIATERAKRASSNRFRIYDKAMAP